MYDPKCEELADHFLAGEPPRLVELKAELAQVVQDAVEIWFFFQKNELEHVAGDDAEDRDAGED